MEVTPKKRKTKAKKDPRKPKGRLSSYMYFTKATRPVLIKADPTLTLGAAGKRMGAMWKALNEEEKSEYVALADKDKERYEREMAAYRKLCETEPFAGKASRKKKKDPRAPKGRCSSYMFFNKEVRPKLIAKEPGLGLGACAKKIGAMWKELTAEEKAPYVEMANKDKERFAQENAAYLQTIQDEGSEFEPPAKQARQPKVAAPAYGGFADDDGGDYYDDDSVDGAGGYGYDY